MTSFTAWKMVHGRVETHAALVRADRRAVLNPERPIHLYLVAVVGPGHAKLDHALGSTNRSLSVLKFLGFEQTFKNALTTLPWAAEPIDTATIPKFTEGSGEGMALRDYRPLAKKYKADKLLLVTARSLGTVRSYYAFMPLSAPEGYVALTGQLIDLSTNRLEWYERVETYASAKGDWDQAPEYDNLMHAVDESTRAAAAKLRGAFFMERISPTAPVAPAAPVATAAPAVPTASAVPPVAGSAANASAQ